MLRVTPAPAAAAEHDAASRMRRPHESRHATTRAACNQVKVRAPVGRHAGGKGDALVEVLALEDVRALPGGKSKQRAVAGREGGGRRRRAAGGIQRAPALTRDERLPPSRRVRRGGERPPCAAQGHGRAVPAAERRKQRAQGAARRRSLLDDVVADAAEVDHLGAILARVHHGSDRLCACSQKGVTVRKRKGWRRLAEATVLSSLFAISAAALYLVTTSDCAAAAGGKAAVSAAAERGTASASRKRGGGKAAAGGNAAAGGSVGVKVRKDAMSPLATASGTPSL